MGNDDFSPTKRMTGGTIPALIWHNVMAYAHQGIKLRPLPGLPPPQHAPIVANAALGGAPVHSKFCFRIRATRPCSALSICLMMRATRSWPSRPPPESLARPAPPNGVPAP